MAKQSKTIDETHFVRHMLQDSGQRAWEQYAAFVIGARTRRSLLKYELTTSVFGSLPGAIGLAARRSVYPCLLKRAGKRLTIGRNVVLRHADKIELGDNVSIDDGCVLDGRGAGAEGLIIGDNVIIGRGTIVQCKLGGIRIDANCNIGAYSVIITQGSRIDVEEWCQIAGGCKISGGRFKPTEELSEGMPYTRESTGAIRLGKACFLGMGVIVADGCDIGALSAIGPGAVITQNVPASSIVMARPAVLVGSTRAADE